ncbi:MAG: cupin domain-containing protein [Candidatus Limnocylindria bacterium]
MNAAVRLHHGGVPDPTALERSLRDEARDVYAWTSAAGDRFAIHEHPYTKVLYCVRGSIEFTLADGTSLALSAGDRLTLQAGTRHGATVGADGCDCIEGRA